MNHIDIFPWDDNFNTGLQEVDEQHHQLVCLLNRLASQFAFQSGSFELEDIFSDLLDYTVYHFSTEEAIWRKYLPDDAAEANHRDTHQQFIDSLHELIAEQKDKSPYEIADRTLNFLVQWLASHILESDRYMAYLVFALKEGASQDQAKVHAAEMMSGFTRKMIDIVLSIYSTLSSNTLQLMRELSRQKELQDDLARQRGFFKSLIQTLPDLVWLKDPDGVYLACNSRFERFFGASEAEILGKSDYDFVDRELADFFRAHDQKAIEKGCPSVNEEWITFAEDGHRELLETTKTPMYDDQGKLIGVLGIGHDVTEQKAAEQRLKEANERLEEAQRLGNIGHWELDLKTGELQWSKQIYEIFGVDPGIFDLSYEAFLDAVHPDDRNRVDESYQFTVEHGVPYDIVHRIIRDSDKKTRYVRERSTEVRDQHGKAIRSLGTVQDITDSVLAEQSSLEHQKRIEDALRKTVETIALTVEQRDPYTAGHQRRVAELATAIAQEMGLSQEIIEGIYMGSMIHDLGKISIPAEILVRPVKLSYYEYEMIKRHSDAGYDIVKEVEFPWPVAEMIRQHHERMDGSGYPQGLKGDEIIIEARILAVADVIEAMSSHRPYRAGLGIDTALQEIKSHRGSVYDEVVVDSCVRLFAQGYILSHQ